MVSAGPFAFFALTPRQPAFCGGKKQLRKLLSPPPRFASSSFHRFHVLCFAGCGRRVMSLAPYAALSACSTSHAEGGFPENCKSLSLEVNSKVVRQLVSAASQVNSWAALSRAAGKRAGVKRSREPWA